jgi:2-polyprenyl-3-methyl-5-hydroxy-6-metoxy-1,4-benzoquinol methylase
VRTRLNRCPACGFLFQPELPLDELRSHHDAEYFEQYSDHGSYDAQGAQRRREARIRLRWMRLGGARSGRLLEVGVARGDFLAEARRAGFEPLGIEPEPATAEVARQRSGVEVLVGWAEEVELPRSTFDVVCLWHVLEHIPEPRTVLEALLAGLRPGGLLFCEVPNAGGTMAVAQRDRWAYLDPAHHVGFFDPHSMRRGLAASGYEGIVTETIPMLRYAPLDASTVLRKLPRRVTLAARHHMPVIGRHPCKHDLLRACARRPRSRSASFS